MKPATTKSRRKLRRFSAPERPLLPAVRAVSKVSRRRFYGQVKTQLTLFYCRRVKMAVICGFALTLFQKMEVFSIWQTKKTVTRSG